MPWASNLPFPMPQFPFWKNENFWSFTGRFWKRQFIFTKCTEQENNLLGEISHWNNWSDSSRANKGVIAQHFLTEPKEMSMKQWMPTACLYSLSRRDSLGKGLIESAAARHLQMGFDGDWCPVLLRVPDWMIPQALKLGRNPLQYFKPFCVILLATGKGPRDPHSYWAVVNSIVSIVYSPFYSTAKGHIIHTSWKDRGGEIEVEMPLQLPGFSLSLKDLLFSPATEQAPRGWMAGTAGRTWGCQEGHQQGMPETPPPGMSPGLCSPSGQSWGWRACLYAETRLKTLIWPASQWPLAFISCLTFACIKINHFLFSRTVINPPSPSAVAQSALAA